MWGDEKVNVMGGESRLFIKKTPQKN